MIAMTTSSSMSVKARRLPFKVRVIRGVSWYEGEASQLDKLRQVTSLPSRTNTLPSEKAGAVSVPPQALNLHSSRYCFGSSATSVRRPLSFKINRDPSPVRIGAAWKYPTPFLVHSSLPVFNSTHVRRAFGIGFSSFVIRYSRSLFTTVPDEK